VELQLRDERAEGFVRAAGTVGEKFRGVLANYVRFVVPSEDSNKRRWPTAPYWEKLLGSAEAISVYTKPKADYTIDQLEAFVVRQAGNAISAYIEIRGVNGFLEAVKERHTMPNPKYEALKSKLREPIEKRELSREEIYASGLELARYKDFDKPSQVVDSHGYRWLVCEECGELRRADEMVSYGGWKMNYGVCRACSNG
jgi:hypothetical protein